MKMSLMGRTESTPLGPLVIRVVCVPMNHVYPMFLYGSVLEERFWSAISLVPKVVTVSRQKSL